MSEKKNLQDQSAHQQETSDTGEEHRIRVAKVEAMRAAGIEPWPASRDVNATCEQVHREFEEKKRVLCIMLRVV